MADIGGSSYSYRLFNCRSRRRAYGGGCAPLFMLRLPYTRQMFRMLLRIYATLAKHYERSWTIWRKTRGPTSINLWVAGRCVPTSSHTVGNPHTRIQTRPITTTRARQPQEEYTQPMSAHECAPDLSGGPSSSTRVDLWHDVCVCMVHAAESESSFVYGTYVHFIRYGFFGGGNPFFFR